MNVVSLTPGDLVLAAGLVLALAALSFASRKAGDSAIKDLGVETQLFQFDNLSFSEMCADPFAPPTT